MLIGSLRIAGWRRVAGVAGVTLLVACGSGDTGPAPPVPAALLTVSPNRAVLAPGETLVARADARTAQGLRTAVPIAWQSANQAVATVTAGGSVVAVGLGTTTITATTGSVSATLELQVAPPGLDRIVDSVRRAFDLPAMGGAIVTRTGTVGLAVTGSRRATGGPAATVDDKWHIGSNLKAVTAALGAIAVDQGKIAWSTTVGQAFPELAATMRTEYRDVTLADLLSHRGGIRNDPPGAAFVGATAVSQRASLVAWTVAATPVGPVGGYAYSNLGYVLAGAMIERAWGGVFEDLLATRLLQPLGISGLGWGPQAAAGATDQPVAHSLQSGTWVPCEGCDNPPGLSAAGRAHLPLGDWARLIREFLVADAGTSTLIAPATGRDLFTARVPLAGTDGYGLGWVLVTRTWAGGRAAAHEGSNTVNHSVAWLGLGRGIGVIAVTNAADLIGGRTSQALDVLVGRMLAFHESGR